MVGNHIFAHQQCDQMSHILSVRLMLANSLQTLISKKTIHTCFEFLSLAGPSMKAMIVLTSETWG